MTNLVIDASAGVELLLNSPSGRALTRKLPPTVQSWAPEHYFVEVGNVLRRLELAGTVPPARIAVAFEELRAGSLHRVQVRPLMDAAWAKRGHLTFPDALYVVLAEQLEAALVTADLNLARSPNLPVPTITP